MSLVNLLLDTLLTPDVSHLINSNDYENALKQYLESICNGSMDLTQPDSITLELLELENQESLYKSQIQKRTVASMDMIIQLHDTLETEWSRFNEGFNGEVGELYENAGLDQQWSVAGSDDQSSDAAKILLNIDGIMDILELPLLTLACVRQGHYSESLEISAHVKRLSIRYSDIQLINKIDTDIKQEINKMLVGLIRLLRTDLKQSSILKIMTYLKRISPFTTETDRELKLIYLQLRYHYIINELEVLEPIRNNNIEKFLKRNVEVVREHCFSTIVTFENIFGHQQGHYYQSDVDTDDQEDLVLLREFVLLVVNRLILALREILPQINDKTAKENLLLQLCYCSNSLNRIGFEFGPVLLSELEGIISIEEWLGVSQRKKKLAL